MPVVIFHSELRDRRKIPDFQTIMLPLLKTFQDGEEKDRFLNNYFSKQQSDNADRKALAIIFQINLGNIAKDRNLF